MAAVSEKLKDLLPSNEAVMFGVVGALIGLARGHAVLAAGTGGTEGEDILGQIAKNPWLPWEMAVGSVSSVIGVAKTVMSRRGAAISAESTLKGLQAYGDLENAYRQLVAAQGEKDKKKADAANALFSKAYGDAVRKGLVESVDPEELGEYLQEVVGGVAKKRSGAQQDLAEAKSFVGTQKEALTEGLQWGIGGLSAVAGLHLAADGVWGNPSAASEADTALRVGEIAVLSTVWYAGVSKLLESHTPARHLAAFFGKMAEGQK